MAGTLITTDILELESQRKGYNGISLTEWTSSLEPEITLGSIIEIAGAMVEFQANEDIDLAGAFGGIAANTTVYGVIDGVTLIPYLTTTVPTWNTELQGYYDATSQHRYYMSFYKDGAGGYIRKNILQRIQSIYVKDYAKEVDAYQYSTAGVLALQVKSTNNGAYNSIVKTTKYFYLKKPIHYILKTSMAVGTSGSSNGVTRAAYLIYVSNYSGNTSQNYLGIVGPNMLTGPTVNENVYKYTRTAPLEGELNPGKYKIVVGALKNPNNNKEVVGSLYLTGMYGGTTVTKNSCIDT